MGDDGELFVSDGSLPAEALSLDPGARHALVLSGGGAHGAYEIGVMKALFAGASPATGGRPLAARSFTGTSVGAYNAAFLAQEETPGLAAVERLEAIWLERLADTPAKCGNGVYRLRASPFQLLDLGCFLSPVQVLGDLGRDALFWGGYATTYGAQLLAAEAPLWERALETVNLAALFSREPLEELLAETIDLSRLRAAPNSLAIAVSDWKNGESKVYRKADMVDRLGTNLVLASTAVPGIFEPVVLDGIPCVDGGLLMNTPFKPAIADGAVVLHVIFVDPRLSEVPFPPLPNTLDTFYRLYSILLATQIRGDARVAATVNEELATLAAGRTARGRELPVVRAKQVAGVPMTSSPDKVYRPLEIHLYWPSTVLGGAADFLDFSAPVIGELIRQGYEDGRTHDCSRSRCVLPPASAGAARQRPLEAGVGAGGER